MIFDFGPIAEFYHVTVQYSNAVLLAILPHVGEFAAKVDKPAGEFNTNSVRRLFLNQKKGDMGGSIEFTNGCAFGFQHGYISYFATPHAYTLEQDPEQIPTYYGPVRMTKAEAIAFARKTILRLGYSLESVFADLEPETVLPEKIGKNVIPIYELKWRDPRGGMCVEFEINASERALKKVRLWSHNLDRLPFSIPVEAPSRSDHPLGWEPHGINPKYGYQLFPYVLRSVSNFAARTGIVLPNPLTTNHLKRFRVDDNGGWPVAELEFTNGTRFLYRNTNVAGYFAPDDFWNSDMHRSEKRKMLLSDVAGSWRMTDKEMMAMARSTLARLDYSKEFVQTGKMPELIKPQGEFARRVPRCLVQWMYPNPETMTQWSYVEIDADKKEVKAIYFDDKSFWGNNPLIGVPISTNLASP